MTELFRLYGRVGAEAQRVKEELKQLTVEGSAGGGMVKVRMNGVLEVLECKLEPQLWAERDAEMVEDLIVAAMNQALVKARSAAGEKFSEVLGGTNMPAVSDAIAQLLGTEPKAS